MFDSLTFADKFTFRVNDSADIKFTDYVDDTGTTTNLQVWFPDHPTIL